MKTRKLFLLPLYHQFFGEGEGEGEGEGGGEGEGKTGTWDGKFTPEQQTAIDRAFDKRFAKEKQEKEKLLGDLRNLRETAKLTDQERADLTTQIDTMENSLLTEQQKTAKIQKDATNKYERDTKKLKDEAEQWQNRYTDATINQAIVESSLEQRAKNSQQLQLMLRGSSYLSEDKDESGQPTGTFTPRAKIQGIDHDTEDKQITTFDLPIGEAIKKLRNDGLNNNLFEENGTGGTGRKVSGQGSGGEDRMPTLEDFNGDEVKFAEKFGDWREKYELDGTRKSK